MSHLSIFNIGTGHNRNEKNNLLVKLFDDSPALAIDDAVIDRVIAGPKGVLALDGDRKIINDGLGSEDPATGKTGKVSKTNPRGLVEGFMGVGLKDKTTRMVTLIERARREITEVTIVGHSRGAIIAVRIAAKLWDLFKKDLPVDLWLVDPVEFSAQGTAYFNRELHPNVRHCRIVVMEDTHDICGYRGGFKLQVLAGSADPGNKTYIRMPGSHGTGTQVNDNHPIGQVTFQTARRDFWLWNVPVGANVWSTRRICEEYFRIHEQNPATKKDVGRMMRLLGHTTLSRVINDEAEATGSRTMATDSRAKKLDGHKITNRFRGHLFFINEHHFKLFQTDYPNIANAVLELSNNVDMTWDKVVRRAPRTQVELEHMEKHCPRGRLFLETYVTS